MLTNQKTLVKHMEYHSPEQQTGFDNIIAKLRIETLQNDIFFPSGPHPSTRIQPMWSQNPYTTCLHSAQNSLNKETDFWKQMSYSKYGGEFRLY